MSDIKPIPTYYAGYYFRSRLEARWAVFFHSLGVHWEYEPEGFQLPNGMNYLPDFRVKCYGKRGSRECVPFDLWIEVKGHMTQEDAVKVRLFAGEHTVTKTLDGKSWTESTVERPVLILHDIPDEECSSDSGALHAYDQMDGCDVYPFNYQLIDGDYFAAYPAAHHGHFYLWGDDSNYINRDDVEAVEQAYRNARQARFEYGEHPHG